MEIARMETARKMSAARTLPNPPTLSPWAMPPLSTRDESQDGFGCHPVYSDDCRSTCCSFQGNLHGFPAAALGTWCVWSDEFVSSFLLHPYALHPGQNQGRCWAPQALPQNVFMICHPGRGRARCSSTLQLTPFFPNLQGNAQAYSPDSVSRRKLPRSDWGLCVCWGGAVLLKSQESCFEFREVAFRAAVPSILGTSQGPPSSLNCRVAN